MKLIKYSTKNLELRTTFFKIAHCSLEVSTQLCFPDDPLPTLPSLQEMFGGLAEVPLPAIVFFSAVSSFRKISLRLWGTAADLGLVGGWGTMWRRSFLTCGESWAAPTVGFCWESCAAPTAGLGHTWLSLSSFWLVCFSPCVARPLEVGVGTGCLFLWGEGVTPLVGDVAPFVVAWWPQAVQAGQIASGLGLSFTVGSCGLRPINGFSLQCFFWICFSSMLVFSAWVSTFVVAFSLSLVSCSDSKTWVKIIYCTICICTIAR